jgi:phosphoglycolate phosphatase
MPPPGGEQISETPLVSLVCCGLIGTTVADDGMVDRAYSEAIATQGVVTGTTAYARCMAQVHRSRGRAPIDVLQSLFPESQARAQAAQLAFDRSFSSAVDRTGVAAVPGTEQALARLADMGTRVCLVTGFSRRVLGLVLDTLGWWDRVDLAVCPDDVPRGCPAPDLVLSAMLRLGIRDVRDTAVAQATESGVLSGKRSGAGVVAGVLTGIHTKDRLHRAGATHLLGSIADLPGLLTAAWGGTEPVGASASASASSADRSGDQVGLPVPPQAAAVEPGVAAAPPAAAPGTGPGDGGSRPRVPLERRISGL